MRNRSLLNRPINPYINLAQPGRIPHTALCALDPNHIDNHGTDTVAARFQLAVRRLVDGYPTSRHQRVVLVVDTRPFEEHTGVIEDNGGSLAWTAAADLVAARYPRTYEPASVFVPGATWTRSGSALLNLKSERINRVGVSYPYYSDAARRAIVITFQSVGFTVESTGKPGHVPWITLT